MDATKTFCITIDGEAPSELPLVVTKGAIREVKLQIIKENGEININIFSNHPAVKAKAGKIAVRQ